MKRIGTAEIFNSFKFLERTLIGVFFFVGVIFLLMLLQSPRVFASPQGGSVVSGQAAINQSSGTTTIQQVTNNVIINWNSFNIGSGELVQFLQPSALSAALNRVIGGNPSVILGELKSNGRVFLINPDGILFGPGSVVDTGSFIASTLNISSQDFLLGDDTFNQLSTVPASFIVNQGTIQAGNGGSVVLLAPLVDNEGKIIANLGSVGLGAATHAVLSYDSNGLVNLVLSNPSGVPQDVTITPAAYTALLQQVVNNKGVLPATSVEEKNGEIVLTNAGGTLVNAGSIEANGVANLAAGSISLNSTQDTDLVTGSLIAANGEGQNSNGGDVVVNSEGSTYFNSGSEIEAEGGVSGNGGKVEVSDKAGGVIAGSVDVGAVDGELGSLYIDPTCIEIVAAAGTDADSSSDSDVSSSETLVAASTIEGATTTEAANTITIDQGLTITMAQGASLTLCSTTGDIVFESGSGIKVSDSGTANGSITLKAGASDTSGDGLGNMTLNNADLCSQSGSISLVANNNVTGSGANVVSQGVNGGCGAAGGNGGAITLTAGESLSLTNSSTVESLGGAGGTGSYGIVGGTGGAGGAITLTASSGSLDLSSSTVESVGGTGGNGGRGTSTVSGGNGGTGGSGGNVSLTADSGCLEVSFSTIESMGVSGGKGGNGYNVICGTGGNGGNGGNGGGAGNVNISGNSVRLITSKLISQGGSGCIGGIAYSIGHTAGSCTFGLGGTGGSGGNAGTVKVFSSSNLLICSSAGVEALGGSGGSGGIGCCASYYGGTGGAGGSGGKGGAITLTAGGSLSLTSSSTVESMGGTGGSGGSGGNSSRSGTVGGSGGSGSSGGFGSCVTLAASNLSIASSTIESVGGSGGSGGSGGAGSAGGNNSGAGGRGGFGGCGGTGGSGDNMSLTTLSGSLEVSSSTIKSVGGTGGNGGRGGNGSNIPCSSGGSGGTGGNGGGSGRIVLTAANSLAFCFSTIESVGGSGGNGGNGGNGYCSSSNGGNGGNGGSGGTGGYIVLTAANSLAFCFSTIETVGGAGGTGGTGGSGVPASLGGTSGHPGIGGTSGTVILSASSTATLEDVNGNGITGLTDVNAPNLILTATGSGCGITVNDQDAVSNLIVSTNNGNVTVSWPTSQSLTFASGDLNAAANGNNTNLTFTNTSGSIVVGSVNAGTGTVTLTANGNIEGSGTGPNVIGGTLTLNGTNVGNTNELFTQVSTLNGSLTGSVLLSNDQALTVGTLTASGTVNLTTTLGDLTVDSLSDGTNAVNLAASGGSIEGSGSGATPNVTGGILTLNGTNVGNTNELFTQVSALDGSLTGSVFLSNDQALTVGTLTASGTVNLTTTLGDLTVDSLSDGTNAVNLAASGGSILVGSVNAGTGAVSLTASGSIEGSGTGPNVTGGTLTLSGVNVGNTNELYTQVNTLNGTLTGSVLLSNDQALTVGTLTAAGAVNLTTTSGNLLLDGITTSGSIDLSAAGSILDLTNGTGTDITAGANSVLQAGGVIGLLSDPLTVDITNGSLGVLSKGINGKVSVDINGTVAPSNTLEVLNSPLGEVIFNGNILYSPYAAGYPYLTQVPLSGIETIGTDIGTGLTFENYYESLSQNDPYIGVIPSVFMMNVNGYVSSSCESGVQHPLWVRGLEKRQRRRGCLEEGSQKRLNSLSIPK